MSEQPSQLKIHCPECGSIYWVEATDESWPHCEDCGFTQYDADTLALQAEVRREPAQCKQILGYVPSYQEAVLKGLIKL